MIGEDIKYFMQKKVSICVPCYNGADYLERFFYLYTARHIQSCKSFL